MPSFSQKSEAKLETCHPDIQKVMREVIKHFDFTVIYGHRGHELQDKLFMIGVSKTPYPKSKHNSDPSDAIDIAPYPVDWNDLGRFYYLAGFVMATALNMGIRLRYGGDWNMNTEVDDESFRDLGHFERVK